MTSRGIARVGLLASGLVLSSLMVSTPEIARSEALSVPSAAIGAPIGGGDGGAIIGGHGDYIQHLGCDKPKKPSCNKPGRRSTRR